MGGRVGEAAAAHQWRRRYYFADPAEVARRVYFPRPGYFCLLFCRGRKQNNRPEGTQAAGWARPAAAAGAGRRCPRPAGGRRGLLRPARAVPAALRTVSGEARERAAHLLPCARPVSPGPEPGFALPCPPPPSQPRAAPARTPLPLRGRQSRAGGVGLRPPPPARCRGTEPAEHRPRARRTK